MPGVPVLAALALVAALLPQGAAEGVAPELVESLRRKLEAISGEGGAERPSRIRVSDAELNAYLNDPASVELPPGVSDLAVTFREDGLTARAWIDLERLEGVPDRVSGFTGAFGLLGGEVPIEIEGRLQSDSGFARFELKRVSVASMPVPIQKVEELVLSSTRSERYPHGFDIHSPFRLPYAVQRVTLSRGKALLEF